MKQWNDIGCAAHGAALLLALPLLLLGCGGGGGSSNSTSTSSYVVSTSAGTGGTISPSSATVNDGGTTSVTVTADTGYGIGSVSGCGGSLSGSTYTTGAVTADCTVTASFTLNSYTVSTSAGTGGVISPSNATVDYNTGTSFTVTADTGYVIDTVSGCGGSLSGNTYTTGGVTANCTVTASFIATHAVSTSVGMGGAISPASATVNDGSTTRFTLTPDIGYGIGSVSGCGGSLSGSTYTTGAVTADCTVTAAFDLEFAWMSGAKTFKASGVYGTLGTADPANVPGARTDAVTWTDAGGDLWLFGGNGYDSTGTLGFLNDLWKYSSSSGQWTWMGGSDTVLASGIYGTQGTADAANIPGARQKAVSLTDASGNQWLFGGIGYDSVGTKGSINDLWKYNTSTGQWTWISGSDIAGSSGVYGTQGTADPANVPGARRDATAWIDAGGNLWLFGGYGRDSAGSWGVLNDLWKYDTATGEWTWMSGSNNTNASGVYGTRGTADAANVPGARQQAVNWTDSSGNLWLFGGEGYDSGGTLDLINDLWQYSPSSGQWTWIAGSDIGGAGSHYGTQGTAATTNIPGARQKAAGWTDASGTFWLFGGEATSAGSYIDRNDLWSFQP